MLSGLESATLWALQLGTAVFAFLAMLLMICSAFAGLAWMLFRIRYWLEAEHRKMKAESGRNSLALSESDLERIR